jgi:cell division protease FtsH
VPNNFGKNIVVWLIFGLLLVAIFNMFQTNVENTGYSKLAFSEFLNNVDGGKIADVTIKTGLTRGAAVVGHLSDGTAFVTQTPDYPNLVDKLTAKNKRD